MKRYKSAYVLGKFLPFHNGHKFLIDTAISKSKMVTILIGSLPTDPIPGEVRYNWIKNTYIENKNVSVKWCNEVLPQFPEEDTNFWKIWVDVAKRYCPKDIDVIFTSELYGNEYSKRLGINHYMVDLDRISIPISGTAIRNNIFDNWKFLTEESKQYFVKKVAILGPESTGKSVISKNLAEHYKTEFVEEYGRTFYEMNGNKIDNVEDFITISKRRQEIENSKVIKSNKILICDTEDITTYYLSKEYFPGYVNNQVDSFFKEKIEKSNYDIYILLSPDCDAVQDGTRVFLEKRKNHYKIIKDMVIKKKVNFFEVGGDWNNRFIKSIEIIDRYLYNKKSI